MATEKMLKRAMLALQAAVTEKNAYKRQCEAMRSGVLTILSERQYIDMDCDRLRRRLEALLRAKGA